MSIFGKEFEKIWPKAGSSLQLTDFGKKLLKQCETIKKPEAKEVDIDEFKRISSNFPLEFGTNTCRVMSQPKDRYPNIQKQIASAYPVIHERVLQLYLDFLEHKCQYGNSIEKEVYQNLTLNDFIQRLLTQRCASFFSKNDKFLLLTRVRGCSGFMDVGTIHEKPPLLLKNVLSYDEIKLSALLSVSSYSELINNGNRQNCGVIEKNKSLIERDGIVMGLIGARLTRRDVMEFQDIVIAKKQNTKENGYGFPVEDEPDNKAKDYRHIWKKFYEEPDFLFENVKKDQQRFDRARNENDIFDNLIMKKRYCIAFDTLLLESEARAKAAGQQAYIHVVGIGLGVWKAAEQQEKIFLETFSQRVNYLLPKLPHIGVLLFSWFHLNEWGDLKNGSVFKSDTHPEGGIKCFISKRNPADKLKTPENDNMLLIISYAWDGNALPGNEFWMKMLKSTGDSSTACSTLITEIHNPHINSEWVNGNNLHIASEKYGIVHIADYAKTRLSAFLSISSHTELINDGNRDNEGVIEKDLSKIEREGIVIGLIGARFEESSVMEYQDILITEEQNVSKNGYGYSDGSELLTPEAKNNIEYRKLWEKFYENKSFLHDNIPNDPQRFQPISPHSREEIFDNVMMKKRYAITFDTLLLESQARAKELNKQAYIHVVGIGLGVWKIAEQQTKIFLECFTQRVNYLLPQLNNIGVLHFSWFHMVEWMDLKHNGFIKSDTHSQGGIKTFLKNRNPADKLKGSEYENMLLVISYAWDGNALPGNEFWEGSLDASNDPSTACSTLITEIHNPHINYDYVNGNNLHIASSEHGVLHISDYVKSISKQL